MASIVLDVYDPGVFHPSTPWLVDRPASPSEVVTFVLSPVYGTMAVASGSLSDSPIATSLGGRIGPIMDVSIPSHPYVTAS